MQKLATPWLTSGRRVRPSSSATLLDEGTVEPHPVESEAEVEELDAALRNQRHDRSKNRGQRARRHPGGPHVGARIAPVRHQLAHRSAHGSSVVRVKGKSLKFGFDVFGEVSSQTATPVVAATATVERRVELAVRPLAVAFRRNRSLGCRPRNERARGRVHRALSFLESDRARARTRLH